MTRFFIYQKILKPFLDRSIALILLLILFSPLLLLIILTSIDTKSFGLYSQYRVGRYGRLFRVYKLKTMIDTHSPSQSSVTSLFNPRITTLGAFLRRLKLDELPQLYNILIGDMSFVGPRPDVPGYLDSLSDKYSILLSIKPGITCLSSLFFRNEEFISSAVKTSEQR